MQDCVQGSHIQDFFGEAPVQASLEKMYTRDAIGREVIADGLIRMQISSKKPAIKAGADQELDPQTVEEIQNKLLYIEELIAQTENVLQTLMSYADLD